MSAKRRKSVGDAANAAPAPVAKRPRARRSLAPGDDGADAAAVAAIEARHAAAAVAAIEARHAAAASAAAELRRRAAFEAYPSTEGLWAWGKDYPNWDVEAGASRAEVVDALVRDCEPPASEAAFQSNWRKVMGHKRPKTAPPDESPGPSDDEGSDSEPASPPPAAAASSAAAAAREAPPAMLQCPHCGHAQPRQWATQTTFLCGNAASCGFNTAHAASHPFNVEVAAERSARRAALGRATGDAPSAPSGQSTTATAPKSSLAKRDAEFERLADEGEPYPLFDDRSPVTTAAALALVRRSWNATSFTHPSTALVRLIQSGKLGLVCSAIPMTVAAHVAAQSATRQTQVAVRADGGLEASEASLAPPALTSLGDFVEAFTATIAPALIERPRPLMEWISLLRTATAISARYSWAVARTYVERRLNDAIARRAADFGDIDLRMLDSAALGSRENSAQGGGQPKQGPKPSAKRPNRDAAAPRSSEHSAQRSERANGKCVDWNGISGRPCTRGPGMCKYKHECSNCNGPHPLLECPSRAARATPAAGATAVKRH